MDPRGLLNNAFTHKILTTMPLSRYLLIPLMVLYVCWLPAAAAEQGMNEQGTVFVDSVLRSRPSFSGKTVIQVAPDTRVTVLEQMGIWFKVGLVDKPETQGWLRRFDIRLDSKAAKSSGGSGLGNMLGGLFGGGKTYRKDPGGVTPTIGIRGLDAVDLQNARPNPAQLKMLDDFRSSPGRADKVASEAGLQARAVEFLKQPEPAADDSMSDSW